MAASSTYPPAESDSMSSRKRPVPPPSRGNSPPEKRGRPAGPPTGPSNRAAQPNARSNPYSPFLSRKGSGAGLSGNIPRGPAEKDRYESYRPNYASYEPGNRKTTEGGTQQTSDGPRRSSVADRTHHATLPASPGTGPSTPVHTAPQAPSMLPHSVSASSSQALQPDQTTSQTTPTNSATLRQIKMNKIARTSALQREASQDLAKNAVVLELQAKVGAQNNEIAQLKQDKAEMLQKFSRLESRFNRVELDLKQQTTCSTHADLSKRVANLEGIGPCTERLVKLETNIAKYAPHVEKIPELIKDVAVLKEQGPKTTQVLNERVAATMRLDKQVNSMQGKHADSRKRIETLENNVKDLEQKTDCCKQTSKEVQDLIGYAPTASNIQGETILDKIANQDNKMNELANKFQASLNDVDKKAAKALAERIDHSADGSSQRLTELEQKINEFQQSVQIQTNPPNIVNPQLHTPAEKELSLVARVSSLEESMDSTKTFMKELDEELKETEEAVHNQRIAIDTCMSFPAVYYTENVDPFKLQVEAHLAAIEQKFNVISQDIGTLKQHPTPRAAFSQLLPILHEELGKYQEEFNKCRREMKTMETNFEGRLDHFSHSLGHLTNQCHNITTEDIYQQMVHWFLESYPSNSAKMILEVKDMKRQFQDLQGSNMASDVQAIRTAEEAIKKQSGEISSLQSQLTEAAKTAQNAAKTANEALIVAKQASVEAEATKQALSDFSPKTLLSKMAELVTLTTPIPSLQNSLRQLQYDLKANTASQAEAIRKLEVYIDDSIQIMQLSQAKELTSQCKILQDKIDADVQMNKTEAFDAIKNLANEVQTLGELVNKLHPEHLVKFVLDINRNLVKGPLHPYWIPKENDNSGTQKTPAKGKGTNKRW